MPGLIDVHQHVTPQVYIDAMATIGVVGSGEGRRWPEWTIPQTIELMDKTGIAAMVGSIASPGLYFGDIVFSRRLARPCNEAIADIVRDRPKRIGGFGVVPLPDTGAACAELSYQLDVLKLDGVCLLSNMGGTISAIRRSMNSWPSSTDARRSCSCIPAIPRAVGCRRTTR